MKTIITLSIIVASLTLSVFGQQSNYQKVRQMNVLAHKKQFVLDLKRADQINTIWRPHFAYVLITEDLTPEQQEFLPRAIAAFEAGSLDEVDRESKELFDRELGDRVFNPGPYTETGSTCLKFSSLQKDIFTTDNVGFDCNCGQTSTNWGCSGSCGPSNSCVPTSSGCSIFYMYPCDGKCST